ncbi:translocation/assembly module TamB domain-containing protein [Croceiramulus getboli]|nr:translocation/assembly module TamB [Flavobacteriaceae bacterium YJPT1-3]
MRRTLLFLVVFFIILFVVLSIPAVQTSIAKKVTQRINEDFGVSINIDRIGLRYDGDLDIKGVYIEDHHQDTLIYAGQVSASLLSVRSLIQGDLNLGDVGINKARFFIKRYQEEPHDNLYVFTQAFDSGTPSTKPFELTATEISLANSRFRYTDENLDNPEVVDFRNLDATVSDFSLLDEVITTQIDNLAFEAKRGYYIRSLEGDFYYDSKEISLEEMILKTDGSLIEGGVTLNTEDNAFEDFNNRVVFDFAFAKAELDLADLNLLYAEFGNQGTLSFTGDLNGTLNDFVVSNLDLNAFNSSRIQGEFKFENILGETGDFLIIADHSQLQTRYIDLARLLPNLLGKSLPEELARLGAVNMTGATTLTARNLSTFSRISTSIGNGDLDLELTNFSEVDRATYLGQIILDDFDLGKLANDPKLGKATLDVEVNGRGFTQEQVNTEIQGAISSLTYNNYTYKNITLSGSLAAPKFNGDLVIDDENVRLDFKGLVDASSAVNTYDFTAEVDYLDLAALNFIDDSLAVLKGTVLMDLRGTDLDDAVGVVEFIEASFTNKNDDYYFKDFKVTSSFSNEIRTITINSPDIVSGEVVGNFKVGDIYPLFRNAIGSLYTNYEPTKLTTDQFMEFDFQIYNKIVEVFVPEIQFEPNTFIRGSVVSDDSEFKLTFRSPEIDAFGILAQKIDVRVDNKNPLFNTYIAADSVNTGFYALSDFNLINVTLRDTLFMRSEFTGGKDNDDQFELSLYHTINEDNNSVLGFKRSTIEFKEKEWVLNANNNAKNKLIFDNNFNDIAIEDIVFRYRNQQIALKGQVRDSTYKNLSAQFDNVALGNITPDIDSLRFNGRVNGQLDLLQQDGAYYPNSEVTISNLRVNDVEMGDLDLKIKGNESLTNYTVDTQLINGDVRALSAKGNINVDQQNPSINLDLRMKDLKLAAFSPLGGDVLSNLRGFASGRATVSGNYKNPDFKGSMVLTEAGLGIPYLDTDYRFKGVARITLDEQKFIFNRSTLVDTKYNTEGQFQGVISHNGFSDWRLDLDIATTRLLVLDTEKEEDALYYGTAFISGEADIYGPVDELTIDVVAETETGTVFKIPLDDTETIGDSSVIRFLSPEEKEARLAGEDFVPEENKALSLNFDLDVDQDALIEIDIDGSRLTGRGVGLLNIAINTNGKFDMFGEYVVYDGTFNFRYGGIVQKDFEVVPLGSIAWNGDPARALLDLSAVYAARANPSILLENREINREIPVNVIINLDGELIQPDITFDFEFPGTSSLVSSELDYRLNDRATREIQAISLVSQGRFFSESQVNTQAAIAGNLLESASGIFNDLFSDEDGKFDIGLDIVQGDNSPNLQTTGRVGFTLSTQISNRVLINGKVGVPTGGVSESAVVGDVEVDFLLNEDGSLRAKVFNRQTDVQFFGEPDGYTQGVAISYSVDFNNFKELVRKIFQGKAEEVEAELRNGQFVIPDSAPPPSDRDFN